METSEKVVELGVLKLELLKYIDDHPILNKDGSRREDVESQIALIIKLNQKETQKFQTSA